MAKDEDRLGEVYLKEVRLSFPKLRKPESSVTGGKEKFGCTLLINPETPQGKKNMAAVKKALMEVGADTWGERYPKKVRIKEDRKSVVKGEDCVNSTSGEPYDGYEGMIAVRAKSDRRPGLWDRGKQDVELENIEDVFYGGCYVQAIIRLYAIDDPDKGGAGMFASIEGLRFWEDGDRFGGAGKISADAFDDDDEDDEDHDEEDDEYGI